ncbi:hypothetical protein Tco_0705874 [Tanacetum coccineum]|uniref:Uncharacterized protein n=1 Tax=Tanacetum coccineum TaxID=301880 RepID=A0ABQ4Y5T4_9ASTR
MTSTSAQQFSLDNALVPLEKPVKIGKCNMRIDPPKTQKEPTYQVVLDALALTTCYPPFLIIVDICPRLLTQEFDALPSDEEIVSFLKELGNKGDIKSITKVVFDHMAQILWGMFYKKNIDFVKLLWEDFTFQIENIDHKKQEKMYYPRFTKAIIHHFISKDKLILMRNNMFMHTAQDYSVLGTMRFDSDAYKTYLAYATGAASPKMKRKLKKPASPTKKRSLVTVEEEEPKPAKKVALRRSKRETTIHQAGGSSEGADFESEVPDKPKGDDERTKSDDEPNETDNPKTSDYEKETQDDEFVHTPEHYVPTDDETNNDSNDVTEEEYDRINEELYGDVNANLTDVEPADKEKDDEEMIVAGHVNVNQEGAGNQVKVDAQATQKTEGLIPSSSISSDYAAKYLNFDNIPLVKTYVLSMLDINV